MTCNHQHGQQECAHSDQHRPALHRIAATTTRHSPLNLPVKAPQIFLYISDFLPLVATTMGTSLIKGILNGNQFAHITIQYASKNSKSMQSLQLSNSSSETLDHLYTTQVLSGAKLTYYNMPHGQRCQYSEAPASK